MIQWVIESAGRARQLAGLVVATDDERIAEAARGAGAQAVMTRADHPSGTDRVAEALASTEADVVVNIQGDEPLIDPVLIDRLVATMASSESADMASAAVVIRDPADVGNPSVVKVVWDAEGWALYFSRSVIPNVGRVVGELAAAVHYRHLGIYAYRREFLEKLAKTPPSELEKCERLEQLRALHIGGRIKMLVTESAAPGVDTPEDLAAVERMLRGDGGRE